MIKKTLVLLAAITLLAVSCKMKTNTIIEGTIKNSAEKPLSLQYLEISKTLTIDSIKVKKDGRFRFKLQVDQPGLYILRNEDGKIINLLVSPGEKIMIEADNKDFDKSYGVHGSANSEFIRQLVEKLTDTRNRLKKLDESYSGKTSLNEEESNEYNVQRNKIIKDQRDYSIAFIIDHLSSVASIYALYQKLNPEMLVLNENRDIQYMKILADTLSVKFPHSDFVKTFVNDARSAEKRYNNMIGIQKKLLEAQTGMPDIKYPDKDSNPVSLSSLKGKYVLLYFWSVYSDASEKENQILEKIFRKYKGKGFAIYAVNIDKNRDNWLKMIRFDDLSFTNVFAPDFPESQLAVIYNVRSIPSDFLLDKEGNIIAKNLFGSELEKWLDNKIK